MHYYKRNIGDYAKKAGRLSMLQHGSYTLLIDACYDREKFPTLDEAIEWTWASTADEIEAVTFVLRKFFTLENGVYIQNRIEEEINEYRCKAETNKRIAINRETKRKENSTNRERSVNEPPPNHKPITNNHKPITINQEKIKEKNIVASAPDDYEETPPFVFILPEWVDKEKWDLWQKTRKGKKMLPEQKQAQVKKLEKWKDNGLDHYGALANAADAGWQGLFEPKPKPHEITQTKAAARFQNNVNALMQLTNQKTIGIYNEQ
jgi:uncharacterized protein YdaU (DUF1376 family)